MASFFENESDDDNSEVDEREYDNGEGSNDEDEDGSEDEEEVDFLEDPEDEAEEDEDESAAPSGEGNAQNSNRADFLSATEIRHLTAAFETCDQDDSGELSFDPFMKCLALMGKKVTAEEGKVFFDKMDEDKSGSIDINEWIGFYAGAMQSDVDEKELLDSFIGLWQQPTQNHPETCQRYDEEEFIPKEKVFEIMTKYGDKLSDEEAAEMIRECKPDSQGRIFFENYRRMLIDTTT
mmetsp:Transcript_23071/g.47179  ORF Transcript_23071/g.47179 Transcript_23071/m.47179 type:complete len:236 (-) Transcript_23071:48-755(-)